MKIVNRAVALVGAIFLMLFAISNRETASLALWPLPYLIELPLYLLFFFSLLIGALIGAFAMWISCSSNRRELRQRRRRIEALERELAATQSQLENRSQALLPASPQPS